MSRYLIASLTLAAVGCGPPLERREDAAAILAFGAVPAVHAQQASPVRSPDGEQLPQPSIQLFGSHGGEARIDFNLAAAAVGLIGEGVLFQVHYSDYSNDGAIRLSGDVAILANFAFQGSAYEDPYADLKLTLAGTARVSGIYYDELYARVSLTTRFHDLEFREDSVQMRLDGYVEGNHARFEFEEEDVIALWEQFAQADQ